MNALSRSPPPPPPRHTSNARRTRRTLPHNNLSETEFNRDAVVGRTGREVDGETDGRVHRRIKNALKVQNKSFTHPTRLSCTARLHRRRRHRPPSRHPLRAAAASAPRLVLLLERFLSPLPSRAALGVRPPVRRRRVPSFEPSSKELRAGSRGAVQDEAEEEGDQREYSSNLNSPQLMRRREARKRGRGAVSFQVHRLRQRRAGLARRRRRPCGRRGDGGADGRLCSPLPPPEKVLSVFDVAAVFETVTRCSVAAPPLVAWPRAAAAKDVAVASCPRPPPPVADSVCVQDASVA